MGGGCCAKFQPMKLKVKSHKLSLNRNVPITPLFI